MSNRVALVTGGGTGIGRATALALAREGYQVVLTGRRMERLAEVGSEAAQFGAVTDVVATDIADPGAVAALFTHIKDRWGRLDLLFNNAGRGAAQVPLEELDFSEWMGVVQTNLTGSFLCTQEAFKIMKSQQPQGGRIINNGSLSAYVPRPRSVAYAATKHAITGLTRSTSLDGRQYNIACGQIDIGNANTGMATAFLSAEQADGSVNDEPTMDVEHVARAIVFMASLPLDTNVQFLTIMATKMPFIGRG
jgi:NAD(P)-dependent dehydrogenase (short-subunit alcohol dehydrogenase family)